MTIRHKAISTLVVAAILVAVPMSAASAGTKATDARKKLFGFVNHYRAQHGLTRLNNDQELSTYAWNHSVAMARERRLFHSTNVTAKIDGRVSAWGENIGYGPSIWRVFRAFVHSSSHRANLLNSRFRTGGFGVVHTGGAYWITTVFYG